MTQPRFVAEDEQPNRRRRRPPIQRNINFADDEPERLARRGGAGGQAALPSGGRTTPTRATATGLGIDQSQLTPGATFFYSQKNFNKDRNIDGANVRFDGFVPGSSDGQVSFTIIDGPLAGRTFSTNTGSFLQSSGTIRDGGAGVNIQGLGTVDDTTGTTGDPQAGGLTQADISDLILSGELTDRKRAIDLLKSLGVTNSARATAIIDGIFAARAHQVAAGGDATLVPQPAVTDDPTDRINALTALSGTFGDRGGLFRDFRAAQDTGQFVNPRFRQILNNQFGGLSSQFLLQGIAPFLGGEQGPDFRSFLASQGGRADRGFDIQGALSNIQGLFQPGADLSSRQQDVVSNITGDRNLGRNVALQSVLGGGPQLSGAFGRFLPDIVSRRFDALADIDPLIDPFTQFARQNFQLG